MSQPIDREFLIRHYSLVTDEELEKLSKSELVPEAMALLQAELERRPIERRRERETAAALAAHQRAVNQSRVASGKVPLDGSGKPVVHPAFGVGAARSSCSLGIFMAIIFALVTFRSFPPAAFSCLIFAAWAYWIRRRLGMNLQHAAIEFLAYTATIGIILVIAFPSVDDSFSSLRGSSLRGLGYLSIAYLWQLVVAGVIAVQLLRKRFLPLDAISPSDSQ